jgi:hypothetical protein
VVEGTVGVVAGGVTDGVVVGGVTEGVGVLAFGLRNVPPSASFLKSSSVKNSAFIEFSKIFVNQLTIY